MPVYNHYYPDSNGTINTAASAQQLVLRVPTVPVTIAVSSGLVQYLQTHNLPIPCGWTVAIPGASDSSREVV